VLGTSVPYFLRATLACSAAVLAFISCQLRSSMYFFLLFARHVLGGDISEGSLFGGERESCPAVKEDGPQSPEGHDVPRSTSAHSFQLHMPSTRP
jgi:hypothetical protein